MPELETVIEDAIEELINDYKKDRKRVSEKIYFTETDVVCKLYSFLHDKLGENLVIHSELRPYMLKGENNPNVYVIGKTKWEEQKKANEGARIDLAIIDTEETNWKSAFEKAKRDQKWKQNGLNYWRILSYPLKVFKVAIEIKIRVRGNIKGIEEDIEKLKMIRKENPKCLTYMVILDRYASFNEIKEFLDDREVSCYFFTSEDAGNAKDE